MDNLISKFETMFPNSEDRFSGYQKSFREYEEKCKICPDSILESAIKELFPQCVNTPLIDIGAGAKSKVRTVLVEAHQKMTDLI